MTGSVRGANGASSKAKPMGTGTSVSGFTKSLRQRPAPILIAACLTGVGIFGGYMYTLANPGSPITHTSSAESGMQHPTSTVRTNVYGRTPEGTIAAATPPRPVVPAGFYGSSRRVLVDRRVASFAPANQTEGDIMASHPAPPSSWGAASTSGTSTVGSDGTARANEPPRVAVVYDASTGRPTLTTGAASTAQYDVPPISGPPPPSAAAIAAINAAARRTVALADAPVSRDSQASAHAATAAHDSGPTDGSRDMVMPDIESTPGVVTIPAGSRIPAVLDGAVDSDLQGPVRAHITSDVCDPRTSDLAIPRGAWLIGQQGGGITNGTRHLGIVWLRLTYPDLTSRLLVATDTLDNEGHAGIAGHENISRFVTFRDTLAASVASSAGQIAAAGLAPRFGGTSTVVVDPSSISAAAGTNGGQQRTQSWTIARNTPFEFYLERDFDRNAPYHGEKCGG